MSRKYSFLFIVGDFMDLRDTFRYLVGGYYGVELMDEYNLKEYVMKDIKDYIEDFIEVNPINDFDYKMEAEKVKNEVIDKVKLQDALIVLNKINASMDLILLIKKRLKKYEKK